MRPFTRSEVETLGALAARGLTIKQIAAELKRPEPTVSWKALRLGLQIRRAPSAADTRVYTAAVVEKIHALAGHMTATEIAKRVGVSLPSLKSWARDKKVSLAKPISRTLCAEYNRLRQMAHRLGLRLSAQNGRVSIWVSVMENLTFTEAGELLEHGNRKARFVAVETAYDVGAARLQGIDVPDYRPRPQQPPPRRISILPRDIRIVLESPCLRASVLLH